MKNLSISSSRRWQFAVAVLAFTAALAGCDRRDGAASSSSSMPASAASR